MKPSSGLLNRSEIESVERSVEWNRLTEALQTMLADATLKVQTLPLCPNLRLALIDPVHLHRKFTLEEQLIIEQNPAYWAYCWAAGHALAALILKNPAWVKGKVVVDVGAGSGVVAIAAALAGASKVIASDLDPVSLLACQLNARLNNVVIEVNGDLQTINEPVDILLVADLLYDEGNQPLLDLFTRYASTVILAESRSPDVRYPGYQAIDIISASTEPDIDPNAYDPYRQVSLYQYGREQNIDDIQCH